MPGIFLFCSQAQRDDARALLEEVERPKRKRRTVCMHVCVYFFLDTIPRLENLRYVRYV